CGVGQLTASGLRTRSFIDHETSARKPPRNCKVGGEKARRKEARQIIVGARQLVRGHRPAGAVPSGTRGRHTPVLAHQLASARKILSCASCISWFDRRVFRGRFPVFRGSIVVYFVVNSLYFVVRSSCISWSIPCISWFDRRVFRGRFPVLRGSIVASFVVNSPYFVVR